MPDINATEFYHRFINEVYPELILEDGRTLMDVYKKSSDFTPVITNIINRIIDSIDPEYTHQNEYFRIDAIGWVSHYQDMLNDPSIKNFGINAHLWDLKIAVEHENSVHDWTDEVMKLIHISCPLKVIIGYSDYGERKTNELEKVNYVAKWMRHIEAFSKGKNVEEYLIILGNAGNHPYDSFDYRGYLYDWSTGSFNIIE